MDIVQQAVKYCLPFWIKYLPYKSFVADIWIDFDDSKAYLIECNPFGIHSASGSALFNWKRDCDILYGIDTKSPQFRYLV